MKILYQGLSNIFKKSNKNRLIEELNTADFRHMGVKFLGLKRDCGIKRKFHFITVAVEKLRHHYTTKLEKITQSNTTCKYSR